MGTQCVKAVMKLFLVFTLYLCLDCTNGRTIDSIIAQASKLGGYKNARSGYMPGGTILTELDMLLTREQYNALYSKQNTAKTPARKKREASEPLFRRWPNKRVPYRIEPNHFSKEEYKEFMRAIYDWQKYTCITFPPATLSDVNFVYFEEGVYCQSFLGMNGGKQSVSLNKYCKNKQAITHELGHVIGFTHEHNRPDRDDHVVIKHENIDLEDYLDSFLKYNMSEGTNFGVPYDYTSIMHYSGTQASINGNITIETKDPAFQEVIGRQDRLSFNDIKLANLMYNCNEQCRPPRRCPKKGFLGKDCRCWCPGNPVKTCKRNIARESPPVKPTKRAKPTAKCTDMDPDCAVLAKLGYCRGNNYIKTVCKASCFLCEGDIVTKRPQVKSTRTPTRGRKSRSRKRPKPRNTCMDMDSDCPTLATLGYCRGFNYYTDKNCKASCSLCEVTKRPVKPTRKRIDRVITRPTESPMTTIACTDTDPDC